MNNRIPSSKAYLKDIFNTDIPLGTIQPQHSPQIMGLVKDFGGNVTKAPLTFNSLQSKECKKRKREDNHSASDIYFVSAKQVKKFQRKRERMEEQTVINRYEYMLGYNAGIQMQLARYLPIRPRPI